MAGRRDGGPAGETEAALLLEISDRVRLALECPVCLELNADPTCDCPRGHALCAACHAKLAASWATTSGCPLCRAPASDTGPATALRLALALPLVSVACRYWPYGCREVTRVRAAADHEAGCAHNPYVRCLAAGCPWLGAYELLHGHVRDKHPEAAVDTRGNRLTVTDVNRIKAIKRRVYLVTANRGSTLMWVLISRMTRTEMQMAVFMVVSGQRPPKGQEQEQQQVEKLKTVRGNAWSTDMGYRLTYADGEGRCKKRSQTCWVGRCPSSMACADDCDRFGDAGSYTTFKPRTGHLEVHWFKHTSVHKRSLD